jgi:hypothetical protein
MRQSLTQGDSELLWSHKSKDGQGARLGPRKWLLWAPPYWESLFGMRCLMFDQTCKVQDRLMLKNKKIYDFTFSILELNFRDMYTLYYSCVALGDIWMSKGRDISESEIKVQSHIMAFCCS